MQLLFEHGAVVEGKGEGKYGSALQMAAKSGNLAAVKWLLEHGADVRVRGGKFGSVLEAAAVKERYAVVSYLEQRCEGSL